MHFLEKGDPFYFWELGYEKSRKSLDLFEISNPLLCLIMCFLELYKELITAAEKDL